MGPSSRSTPGRQNAARGARIAGAVFVACIAGAAGLQPLGLTRASCSGRSCHAEARAGVRCYSASQISPTKTDPKPGDRLKLVVGPASQLA